jgi:hypothetical protein
VKINKIRVKMLKIDIWRAVDVVDLEGDNLQR